MVGAWLGYLGVVAAIRWNKVSEVEKAQKSAEGEPDSKMGESFKSLNKSVGGKETPIPVEAEPAQLGTLIERVNTQGRVHAYSSADLITEISGRLVKLHFRDGDWVKKGQLLAEIDDRSYAIELADAEAKYISAEADLAAQNIGAEHYGDSHRDISNPLAKLEQQYKDKLISEKDYQQKKRQLEFSSGSKRAEVLSAKYVATAKAALGRAKLNLEKCRVVAPFDGEVFGIEVSTGQILNASTKIARIVNLDDLVIKANVLESEIGEININRAATASFTALPDLEPIEGRRTGGEPFC